MLLGTRFIVVYGSLNHLLESFLDNPRGQDLGFMLLAMPRNPKCHDEDCLGVEIAKVPCRL